MRDETCTKIRGEREMNSEDLVKVLKSSGVEIIDEHKFCQLSDDNHFIRDIKFIHNNQEFYITWYKNQMTLSHGCGIDVMFETVEYSGTWPNGFKKNLQFRARDQVVAVIGLEKYAHEKRKEK